MGRGCRRRGPDQSLELVTGEAEGCEEVVGLVESLLEVFFGGQGTDFRPFFEWLEENPLATGLGERLGIYLTDGFGEFPSEAPSEPVLWVVAPGGLPSREFPFGDVARLGLQGLAA